MTNLNVGPYEKLLFRFDSEFYIWEVVDGAQDRLLGPDSAEFRFFVLDAVAGERIIRVETSGYFQVDRQQLPSALDEVDPVPMEVPLALQEPETMREIISRYVQEENMRIASRQDINYVESEEEADDFEIEEESLDFISEEEYRQMQEDRMEQATPSSPGSPPSPPIDKPAEPAAPVDPAPGKPVDEPKK